MNINKTNNIQKIKKLDTNTTLHNLQELPTNMNTQFCNDMIKEVQLTCVNSDSLSVNEDLVFISDRGHVYRKMKLTYGIEKRYVWTILHNNNGACGWYAVDSPALNTRFGEIIMTDGSVADFQPGNGPNTKVFHIKNLRYCLVSPMSYDEIQYRHCQITPRYQAIRDIMNAGKEEIHLYITIPKYGGDMMLGHMYPLIHFSQECLKWTPSSTIHDQDIMNGWKNSNDLSSLPCYNPNSGDVLPVFWGSPQQNTQSVTPQETLNAAPEVDILDWRGLFDWGPLEGPNMSWDTEPLTPWGQEDEQLIYKELPDTVQENVKDQVFSEYRMDPSDEQMYTIDEFVEYYGDDTLWNMMSPDKACKRMMIYMMIEHGQDLLTTKSVNHLLDKIVETFV